MASSKKKDEAKKYQQRIDKPVNYWKKDAPSMTFGREQFRVRAILDQRAKSKEVADIDHLVESITWEDSNPVMQGEVIIRKPDRAKKFKTLQEGHQILLDCDRLGNGNFKPLWRMRCREPSVDGAEGTITFKLVSDLSRWALGEDDYEFRVNKKRHPRPYRGDQIIRAAARQSGARVGRLVRCEKTYKSYKKKGASFVDVVKDIYEQEREKTGKQYVISWREGALYVTTLRRPKYMWLFGPTLINYTYTREALSKDFATQYDVRATVKAKGNRKKKKIHVKVGSATLQRRWGVIKQKLTLGDVKSRRDAIKQAREKLALKASPKKEVTLSHPGIPTLKRGDSLHLQIPEDIPRRNWVVFVSGVTHSVTPGDYTMEITLRWTDPYVDEKGEKIQEKRRKTAAKRKRKNKGKKDRSRSRSSKHTNRSDRGNRTQVGSR